MPEFTAYPHGCPCWVDLSTSDPAAAKTFYGGLFGWDLEDNPTPQGPPYTMASLTGKAVAGIMIQSPPEQEMGVPSHWNTYIAVDDIDATVGKVAGAGGTVVMPPMDVMDAGRMAYVQDPTGAVVGLWQKGRHIGAELATEPGGFMWNELITGDPGAARDFFAEILGWKYETYQMPTGDYYVFTDSSGKGVGGIMAKPANVPAEAPAHWLTYFGTADAEAAAAKAAELGGAIEQEPFDVAGVGKIAVLSDTTGAIFALLQPAPQE